MAATSYGGPAPCVLKLPVHTTAQFVAEVAAVIDTVASVAKTDATTVVTPILI